MTITPDTLVGDVATVQPAAVKVFQRYNIDFCCGGRQPIARACEAAGVPVERVIGELRSAVQRQDVSPRDWRDVTLAELVRHIGGTYHKEQHAELQRLNAMMDKVERVHGTRRSDVIPLARLVRALTQELMFHTSDEDERLFPAIVALERGEAVELHGRALDRFLERLEDEHFTVGRMLQQLHALTSGFMPPDDACNTVRGLYHGLEDLSNTLKEHVHLENNVLFPRAAAIGRARADAIEEA
jgi:regulator of cell morphogenesis and NO signaling